MAKWSSDAAYLLGSLVEHLALLAQGTTLLYELVQVLSSLKYRVDGLVLLS